jgi:hypothetical protein
LSLVDDLTYQMSGAEFDKSLGRSIDEIFKASTVNPPCQSYRLLPRLEL